jgi:hypothetical protein
MFFMVFNEPRGNVSIRGYSLGLHQFKHRLVSYLDDLTFIRRAIH